MRPNLTGPSTWPNCIVVGGTWSGLKRRIGGRWRLLQTMPRHIFGSVCCMRRGQRNRQLGACLQSNGELDHWAGRGTLMRRTTILCHNKATW